MESLTEDNVLDVWRNATLEEQRENIDRVLELIDCNSILKMWKATKEEIKIEIPELIIRIIKEKMGNRIYIGGLWENTPQEVQEKTIEQVMQLYKGNKLAIKKIWKESNESIKESKKEVLAEALDNDEKTFKELEIPEYMPAPPDMFSKEEIDIITCDLKQISFIEVMQSDYIKDLNVKEEVNAYKQKSKNNLPSDEEQEAIVNIGMRYIMSKIPITSIPYFFKQMLEGTPDFFIKLFWNNIDEEVQYLIVEDVVSEIKGNRKIVEFIWSNFSPEMQKRKIKELLEKGKEKELKAFSLIKIRSKQSNQAMLEEIINEDESKMALLWSVLTEQMQMKYFQRVMEMQNNVEDAFYIWQESSEQVQRDNFQKYLSSLNNDSEQIIDVIKATKFPIVEIINYILQEYQGEQLEKIIKGIMLDFPALEELNGKISSDINIRLVIKDASELSIEKLENLSKSFNIITVQMKDDNLGYHQEKSYDVEIYRKCRETIDELLDGIDLSQNLDNPNREKILFGEVIKRLANHMSYDHTSYEKIKKYEPFFGDCANMVGGLLDKTCVCTGYAEIARNVFACCGIESRYISGDNINPGEHGHAWNQIKLDGKWYNMDLTWDRDRIVEGELSEYLLKSDEEFLEHEEYDTKGCKKERCTESVSSRDMKWYLYKQLEIPRQIDTSVRRVRKRRIENAYDMIAESQAVAVETPEKREEECKN